MSRGSSWLDGLVLGVDKADTKAENLSGGEKARLLFALATFYGTHLLILDEPTNHLDVDAREALVRTLNDYEGAVILITHDLGIVAEMADEVAVMYAGRVAERAPGAQIFDDPQHPYTLGLLGSIPKIEENRDRLLAIEGTVPPPFDLPSGCRFHPRCVFAEPACSLQDPELRLLGEGHHVACIRAPVEGAVP